MSLHDFVKQARHHDTEPPRPAPPPPPALPEEEPARSTALVPPPGLGDAGRPLPARTALAPAPPVSAEVAGADASPAPQADVPPAGSAGPPPPTTRLAPPTRPAADRPGVPPLVPGAGSPNGGGAGATGEDGGVRPVRSPISSFWSRVIAQREAREPSGRPFTPPAPVTPSVAGAPPAAESASASAQPSPLTEPPTRPTPPVPPPPIRSADGVIPGGRTDDAEPAAPPPGPSLGESTPRPALDEEDDDATLLQRPTRPLGLRRWRDASAEPATPSLAAAAAARLATVGVDHSTGQRRAAQTPALMDLKQRVHEQLIRDLDPEQLRGDTSFNSPIWLGVARAASERILNADPSIGHLMRQQLGADIADEVLGLGPIEPLLRDSTVTEVMVNGPDRVYYEREGTLYLADYCFRDHAHILHIIEKILRPVGRRLDDSSPMVDARLPDGSRVNAVIPPLAVHGPSVTIRKFSRELLSADDLIRLGTLDDRTLRVLQASVRARLNVLISGGTGTGKTTMLNLLSEFINPRERIVTIEDPAELQIHHENWVSLETRPPNIEGTGEIVQRDLVKNALRMRPDRIIVGECRAGEAFDMLQAMNTGHDGSLTTVHANSPRDALARIENMVLMAGVELPVQAIREQVASGINVLVHLARLMDGSRRVTHISEITGMQGNVISMHDLFLFQHHGIDANGRVIGELQPTGLRPYFMDRLVQYGEDLSIETFIPSATASRPPAAVAAAR